MTRAMKSIRELKASDLPARLSELRKEQVKLKAQAAMGTPPKNPMQLRNTRRAIARLLARLTELHQAGSASKEQAVPLQHGHSNKKNVMPSRLPSPSVSSSPSSVSPSAPPNISSPIPSSKVSLKHATREAAIKHE